MASKADDKDNIDLSELRGTSATFENKIMGKNDDDDLNALAEIVPDLKNRNSNSIEPKGMTMNDQVSQGAEEEGVEIQTPDLVQQSQANDSKNQPNSTKKESFIAPEDYSSSDDIKESDLKDILYAGDDVNSESALSNNGQGNNVNNNDHQGNANSGENLGLGDFNPMSSGQSLSTATQTHEVRMPMYLPTFKPATGCTNASDFIVRCFVARLRSGITVVKHGRSRWCKSRLRVLHIHPDGRSLSWKPATGEPHSPKRPPKLDLTTCDEVRHAWSPDPLSPMYTGTPILRQKCESANAHKSFALIFPKRTVDITSVTADQCKVLMEGFSALCFRLQVANLAGKGNKKKMPEEEDRVSNTASVPSVAHTNNSNQITSPPTRR
mmetsp:Transcript_2068/g.4472  ORF Transcript_2068/g.4472 Transcript_2068/m.4472 type:complete len:381 (-) Transcript_2068:182-1324(-)|eukprot:CAMPEP_0201124436 /NCGR_PEP_ID=MMETSP0850-20130426/13386_1 /ASSEMBLY_ACC=CAM_ASM_000622 /TAXON_ID=183588 /ORGANISM="Pseudo-nitzschia fraudulenta, Strain WWA7" /LENGTH=380 /DNA_ID=CAMNT_0047391817 /DNA_START=274 /DNA_END=1416 /DNA_ORIENTATION=-